MPINVAIVEDNDAIREGLAVLINGSPDFHCSSTHASAEEALKALPLRRQDVVLMDIHQPRMSGIECVKQLKEKLPDVQVMMLTVYEEDEHTDIHLFSKSLATGDDSPLKKAAYLADTLTFNTHASVTELGEIAVSVTARVLASVDN